MEVQCIINNNYCICLFVVRVLGVVLVFIAFRLQYDVEILSDYCDTGMDKLILDFFEFSRVLKSK